MKNLTETQKLDLMRAFDLFEELFKTAHPGRRYGPIELQRWLKSDAGRLALQAKGKKLDSVNGLLSVADLDQPPCEKGDSQMRKLEAEILFLDPDPDDMGPALAVLLDEGFEIKKLDRVDPEGPTIWVRARADSGLDLFQFMDWVRNLMEPFLKTCGADLAEAGPAGSLE